MIKIKYSNSYFAKIKRIKRLPIKSNNAVTGAIKRDLIQIKKIFHDGISKNLLRLEKLSDNTIKEKTRKGYPKPKTPLYRKGDNAGNRSYSNMLIITKIKNGWKLRPSTKQHHSGKMSLKELFLIHEYGALIKKKQKLVIQF